jgi:tetratricopeptide (TPR) repeat protein
MARQTKARAVEDNQLGVAFFQSGAIELAVEQFRRAARRASWVSTYWLNLGVAPLEGGELDEAESALRHALKINSKSQSAHFHLAQLHAKRAAERLESETNARRAEIEAYLALGADYQQASQQPLKQALRASLIPTFNGLMVVGIVTLPGMMTGQILAGSSPLVAVRYQIFVVFMQAAAVALTVAVVVLRYRRVFFTSARQLQLPLGENETV